MQWKIVEAASLSVSQRQTMAQILVAAFAHNWPNAWPTLAEAQAELADFDSQRVWRAAVQGEQVLAWAGAAPQYDGNVWELHPLAVDPGQQRQGIGSALLADVEAQVRRRGGHIMLLGSDDETGMTSLAGVDLFPDPLSKLASLQDYKSHPFVFYQKHGYALVGVIPDANGFGKPDILMAKRLAP